jgi:hypothetical protein
MRPYAVLIDVGTDWPEVVFVGDIDEARQVAAEVPEEIGVSVQAVIAPAEVLPEVRTS